MAAAGALALGGQQLGGRRRLLVDYLSSEACDLSSCEVSWAHYKAVARRLKWRPPAAEWSTGTVDGVQMTETSVTSSLVDTSLPTSNEGCL